MDIRCKIKDLRLIESRKFEDYVKTGKIYICLVNSKCIYI